MIFRHLVFTIYKVNRINVNNLAKTSLNKQRQTEGNSKKCTEIIINLD